jgi:molybdate transport system substrate-binding protein
LFLPVNAIGGDVVTVAVASNFATAAAEISAAFQDETGHRLRLSMASTGKLYAQIVNGAPFDVLLAADSERPVRLETLDHGVAGTRFTYAIGELVLWSRRTGDCRMDLEGQGSGRIAIANPDTAPYGSAAREFLIEAGLWEQVEMRLVIGENIAQALQFVATGNAALGFIARSQLHTPTLPDATCTWPVPPATHAPIEQQAVLLARAISNATAKRFLGFLRSDAARVIIRRHGYRLPETGAEMSPESSE